MKTYGSNLCNIMKPLHNFFHGCPDNGNQLYKRKLDGLLKLETKKDNKAAHAADTVLRSDAQYSSAFERIVWTAVEDTIPKNFLDCNFRLDENVIQCVDDGSAPS